MDRSGLPGPGRGPWEGAPVRTGPGPHGSPFQPHCPLKKKKQCTVAMIRKSFFFFPNDILRFSKQVLENFGLRRS